MVGGGGVGVKVVVEGRGDSRKLYMHGKENFALNFIIRYTVHVKVNI